MTTARQPASPRATSHWMPSCHPSGLRIPRASPLQLPLLLLLQLPRHPRHPLPVRPCWPGEVPNFQAMTKAEITAFCASTYGVSLDGAMTKAELVATATGLLQQTPPVEDDPKCDVPPEGTSPADQPPGADFAAGGNDLGFQGDGADPEFPDDLL